MNVRVEVIANGKVNFFFSGNMEKKNICKMIISVETPIKSTTSFDDMQKLL